MLTTYGGGEEATKEKTKDSNIESQLRTRCAILESQIDVLKKQLENLEKLNKNTAELPPGYHL